MFRFHFVLDVNDIIEEIVYQGECQPSKSKDFRGGGATDLLETSSQEEPEGVPV